MKLFVFGVFLVVLLTSSFVRSDDDDDDDDDEDNAIGGYLKRCTSHRNCAPHQYCCPGRFNVKYCFNLPKCNRYAKCPAGSFCKRIYTGGYHRQSFGQCVRFSTCYAHTECDQSTECCRSNRYFRYCAKRPQIGQRCCPKFACFQCAEGLVCKRKWYRLYGTCQAVPTTVRPTTEVIRPTTEEGSGEYYNGLSD